MATTAPLSAAVLAGGLSRRMGRDKALLRVGESTMIERALSVLSQLSDDVMIVGEREEYHAFGARVVPDAYPSSGALVGIATALRAAQCDFALVVACDMPLLSLPLLRAMAREPRDYDALVPALIGNRNDRAGDLALEPLHAIYSRTCVPSIDARLRAGRLKVWEFLATVRMRTLPAAWVREYDPALTSFVNANDPRELAAARALADVERPVIE